jgi:hypothetical protein
VAESWLHESLCRQITELWVTVGFMELYVVIDLKCGRELVTWTCV